MSVRLTWGAGNAALAESIKIYRSDTTFTASTLPAVLETLAGSATSYDDTTVVRNQLYYYRVGMIRAGEELISELLVMGHYPDTGPGAQKILRGNWELGYFGEVAAANLFTSGSLVAQTGHPGGTLGVDTAFTSWFKFVRKGKILFIPNFRATINTTWIQLYNLGLVHGSEDAGDTQNIATFTGYTGPVTQNKTVTAGAYEFKVRLPRLSDGPTGDYVTDPAVIASSEWVELIGRMGATNLLSSPQNKWSDHVLTNYGNTATVSFARSQIQILMDTSNYMDSTVEQLQVNPNSYRYCSWIPVLELIF